MNSFDLFLWFAFWKSQDALRQSGAGSPRSLRTPRAGSAVLFNEIPPKPTMGLAQSRCSVNSCEVNKCCGGEGYGFQMMVKGRGLTAECSFVPGNQLEVQVTFPAKVSGLGSQLPVELELPATWGGLDVPMGRAASYHHLLPAAWHKESCILQPHKLGWLVPQEADSTLQPKCGKRSPHSRFRVPRACGSLEDTCTKIPADGKTRGQEAPWFLQGHTAS